MNPFDILTDDVRKLLIISTDRISEQQLKTPMVFVQVYLFQKEHLNYLFDNRFQDWNYLL